MSPVFDKDVEAIIPLLKEGGTLLYPSDTIYGLGCNALDEVAVQKVYDLKERPAANPFLILIGDPEILPIYFDLHSREQEVLAKIWPGPFTVLLKPNENSLQHLVGPTGKVGVRFGKSEFLDSLFSKWNGFLLSTSANKSGDPYQHDKEVQKELWNENVDYSVLLDEYPVSNPSTLVEFDGSEWNILRQGEGVLENYL